MNHNQQELNKFSQMADNWWDKQHGSFKLIHILNPLRVDYIERQAGWLSGKKVLDVGCGAGILSEKLREFNAITTGIDMAQQVIHVAKEHAKKSNLDIEYFLESTQSHADKHPEYYDVICCMEMLEHVPSPKDIIEQISKMLKPGGTFVLSTINKNFKAHLFLITLAEKILKWLPKGTHNSSNFLPPYELIQYAQEFGLEVIDATGYHYNPLTKQFWLNQDVSVNYFLTFKKKEKNS